MIQIKLITREIPLLSHQNIHKNFKQNVHTQIQNMYHIQDDIETLRQPFHLWNGSKQTNYKRNSTT
jgi:hypothetical protein